MEPLNEETLVVTMKVGEFRRLMTETMTKKEEPQKSQRIKLKGIRGIADHLGSSTRTVQKMKDKGLFPVYWVGKNLYAYSDEVEAGIKE